MKLVVRVALAFAGPLLASPVAPASAVAAAERAELERFLAEAEVVARRPLGTGVTLSHRLTLTLDGTTHQAVWKTIDLFRPLQRFEQGPPELGFRDSYRNEVAAYELDKLLDLGLVPVTVERRLGGERGSLQLWIEDAMTEADRRLGGHRPPDGKAWSDQVARARIFHQLVFDADYKNASNLLIDPDFKLWVVDNSRAFRTQSHLIDRDYLERFPEPVLAALRRLDEEILKTRLRRWLTREQRRALLARRDLLLERAAELGAAAGREEREER